MTLTPSQHINVTSALQALETLSEALQIAQGSDTVTLTRFQAAGIHAQLQKLEIVVRERDWYRDRLEQLRGVAT